MHLVASHGGPVSRLAWREAEDPGPMAGEVQDLVFNPLITLCNTIAHIRSVHDNAPIGLARVSTADQAISSDDVVIPLNEDKRARVRMHQGIRDFILHHEAFEGVLISCWGWGFDLPSQGEKA